MKNLSLLIVLAFFFGSLTSLDAQERQQQERERQQEEMHRHERPVEITDLPQEVQEKLREDYEDWRPANAAIVTDPEEHEEAFYQVRMHDPEEQETKIILITRDGEVLDEKDDDEGLFDRDRDRDDRRTPRRHGEEYTPAAHQEGQQQQQQQRQEGMDRQQRSVEVTDLPQEVQEKIREDYEEWRPVDAALVTDPEEHEETFYQVRLRDQENEETKIVMITRDGEVLDEKDDDEGLFEREEEEERDDRRRRRGY